MAAEDWLRPLRQDASFDFSQPGLRTDTLNALNALFAFTQHSAMRTVHTPSRDQGGTSTLPNDVER